MGGGSVGKVRRQISLQISIFAPTATINQNFTQTSHDSVGRVLHMKIPLRGEPTDTPFAGRCLLERALVVARFTPVLRIGEESGSGIAGFQEAVRADYPLAELEREAMIRLDLKADGSFGSTQESQPVWRLLSIDRAWRVSLTSRSIALEVNGESYKNWADFSSRMGNLIQEVANHFGPSHRQEIGVRYVNAATVGGDSDPRLGCAEELVSITGNPDLQVADLLWQFSVDEGILLLRSGVMPAGSSYDPNVFAAKSHPNWYLDIDVVSNEMIPFEPKIINSAILAQVRRVHSIYSWAMQRSVGQD